jgi:glycerol-3-phosphate dehydrogenase (NAD(P)+)
MEEEVVTGINAEKKNPVFLKEANLPEGIRATREMAEAVGDAQMVLVVIPSQFVRERMVAVRDDVPPGIPIVVCSKGIERDTLATMHEVLKEELPGKHHKGIAVLSGPSFALEVAKRYPTNVTVACEDAETAEYVQQAVATRDFRVYTSPDVVGVELGGALKNVIAISAGAADGLKFGHNTKAGLLTRGLAEIARLAVSMGGRPETMMGLAGMGDLILTCTGHLSRNRMVGQKLAEGMTLEQIRTEMRMVAEGVATSVSVHNLATKKGVEMPISGQVYEVLHQGKKVTEALETLLSRSLKPEWEF